MRCGFLGTIVTYDFRSSKVRALFDEFKLELDTNLLPVDGRQLAVEELTFGNNKTISYKKDAADWNREAKGLPALGPKDLENWAIVYPSNEQSLAENFYRRMSSMGPGLGIGVHMPHR